MTSYFFGQIQVGTAAGLLTLIGLIAAAVIVILSRKREESQAADRLNVASLEKLVATRDRELADERKKVAELIEEKKGVQKELEATAGELKQIAAIDIQELLNAHNLRRENDALREANKRIHTDFEIYKAGHDKQ